MKYVVGGKYEFATREEAFAKAEQIFQEQGFLVGVEKMEEG